MAQQRGATFSGARVTSYLAARGNELRVVFPLEYAHDVCGKAFREKVEKDYNVNMNYESASSRKPSEMSLRAAWRVLSLSSCAFFLFCRQTRPQTRSQLFPAQFQYYVL